MSDCNEVSVGEYVYSRQKGFCVHVGDLNRYLVKRLTKTLIICNTGRRFRQHDGGEAVRHSYNHEYIEPQTPELLAEYAGQQKMKAIRSMVTDLEKDDLWKKVNHYNLGLVSIKLKEAIGMAKIQKEKDDKK